MRILAIGGCEAGAPLMPLFEALAAAHDVTLLAPATSAEASGERVHGPTFREHRFADDETWARARRALVRQGLAGDTRGLAFALANGDPDSPLRRAARALAVDAGAIVHTSPYSAPLFADGEFAAKEAYLAPDREPGRFAAAVSGPGFEAGLVKLLRLEGGLAVRVRRVFATDGDEAERFRILYGVPRAKLSLCPTHALASDAFTAEPPPASRAAVLGRRLLVVGSPDSRDGVATRVALDVADRFADCRVTIAGEVAPASPMPPDYAVWADIADDEGVRRALGETDLLLDLRAAGPRRIAAVLHALATGVPVVTTPEGARDLGLRDGAEARVVPRGRFADVASELLADPEARRALAAAARRHAVETLTWAAIAERFAAALATEPASPAPDRPLYLALNDYPTPDALAGGRARIRNLLGRLDADVALLTFGSGFETAALLPGVLQVSVGRTRDHAAFEAAINGGPTLTANDCVATLFAGSNLVLTAIATGIAARAAAVIFEHPYMAPVLDAVAAVRPDLPVVYDAHNVEAVHRTAMLAAHPHGAVLGRLARDVEGGLARRADLVVCCTREDADSFRDGGADVLVVPNGCVVPSREALALARHGPALGRPKVGFLGSDHPPNVEAATFILAEVAPAFPTVDIEILGSVCASLRGAVPPNVILLGALDDDARTRALANWLVALNPLASGGGSSLKIPDAMAHEVATLNTPAGARGFAVAEQDLGVVVERDRFVEALGTMLADRTRLQAWRRNAHAYASAQLDWSTLARPYAERVAALASAATFPRPRSLLVVVDAEAEPGIGADLASDPEGDVLPALLPRLRERFRRVDGATVDRGRAASVDALGPWFDRTWVFPENRVEPEEARARAERLARFRANADLALKAPFAEDLVRGGAPVLLGGVLAPEAANGGPLRRTGPAFSILVPSGAEILTLRGTVERAAELGFRVAAPGAPPDDAGPIRHAIEGSFQVHLALPEGSRSEPLVIRCTVDPGPGVALRRVAVLGLGPPGASGLRLLASRAADLDESVEEVLRARRPERWRAAVREAALRVPPEIEADLAAADGPGSDALQAWLVANGSAYDVAIVAASAVAPAAIVSLAASVPRPRIVSVAGRRGTDPFSTSPRERAAFAEADAILASASALADAADVPGPVAVIPGGSSDIAERGDLAGVARFRELRPGRGPFFLVLARRADPAALERAFVGHGALAGDDVPCRLVVIDRDGGTRRPQARATVDDLGPCPREVIRGALADCVAVLALGTQVGPDVRDAWLFGKPVVATRHDAAALDLVTNGETGLLVEPGHDLPAALRALRDDPALARRLGASGFEQLVAGQLRDRLIDAVYAHL